MSLKVVSEGIPTHVYESKVLTKAFEEHRLLQGDEKLTLEKLNMYFDQDYKNSRFNYADKIVTTM
jgi:hypothetical protein